ncbi:MAG TPA: protein translocase subunit SecD [Gaiellaceae bacterium]|nr:protein translocase subunit SecD [Gaiellaceae bacterium]
MRERRNHLVLVALILAALIGAALLAIPGSPLHKKPVLGLDLQGGLEVVLKAVPPPGRSLQKSDLDRSVEIIRNRVDKLGVAEPEIRKQGTDQIAVALPGVKDPDRVRDIIGSTAKLELYDLETSLFGPSISATGQAIPEDSIYDLLRSASTQSLVKRFGGKQWYRFDADGKLVAGPMRSRKALLANTDGKVPQGQKVFAVPNGSIVITCGPAAGFCPPAITPGKDAYYLFKYRPNDEANPVPQMTGEDLRLGGTRQDFDTSPGGSNQPIVTMQFTDAGGDKFQKITRDIWVRGRLRNEPQHFAIVLDREIKSFPQIDPTDASLSNGIGGGRAQIEGNFTVGEAKDLALVLQTGALPVEFQTLSETQISATLGQDSLREALRAAVAGMAAVALFLLLFYRFLGVVAVAGLGIYAVLLYAMILLFNVTLTLPGFAGMILTIGVAADANIVIFERIKEEARGGRSVRAAVSAGYTKGFATIVDANMVTAITALVLFALATAGVRGFALMLLIGTAMSLVTAVFATRAMLGLLAGFRWFNSPRFMGATGMQIPNWIRHDYIGKRNIWFAVSGVVLAVAAISIGVRGLNLGIDFEGGTKVSFATSQPVPLEEVRAQAERIGQGGAVIQGVGESAGNERYSEFQLQTEALTAAEQRRLNTELQRNASLERGSFNVTTVSASFGEQVARGAIYAILLSLLFVVLYITIRFQWKFAVAVILAMLHDILIAVGIYSLVGKEVSTATVAAILTVLGYSIYDTIIILDRVRENMPLMRRSSFQEIANVSLWETIRRSLATTFITLLPITALYLFGGETLKDFAFALLVGIGSGAYSSIFIAAPIVTMLKEREPEYARRKGLVSGEKLPGDEEPPAGDGRPPRVERAPEPPTPEPAFAAAPPKPAAQQQPSGSSDKRERRRQRRSTRPHGRAR